MKTEPHLIPGLVDIAIPAKDARIANGRIRSVKVICLDGEVRWIPVQERGSFEKGEIFVHYGNRVVSVFIEFYRLEECFGEGMRPFSVKRTENRYKLTRRFLEHAWKMQGSFTRFGKAIGLMDAQAEALKRETGLQNEEVLRLVDGLKRGDALLTSPAPKRKRGEKGFKAKVLHVHPDVPEVWFQLDAIDSGQFKKVYKALRVQFGAKPRLEYMAQLVIKQSMIGMEREIAAMELFAKANCVVAGPSHHYSYKSKRWKAQRIGVLMPLYRGSLTDILRKNFIDPVQEFRIKLRSMMQAVTGLEEMHREGYVHCDIKPSNVLVWYASYPSDNRLDFQAHLGDLGFAHHSRERFNRFLGSPMYVAPEVYDPCKHTLQSDMWSFGVTLHQIFYGVISPDLEKEVLADFIEGAFLGLTEHTIRTGYERLKKISNTDKISGLFKREYLARSRFRQAELQLRSLILSLFSIEPSHRPTAEQTKKRLQEIEKCFNKR